MAHKMAHKRKMHRRSFLANTGAVAAGLSFTKTYTAHAAEDAEVNFFNWDTYIGETTLDDFKQAQGIEVNMDLFADNEELFAKLRTGNPGYDVIVPTNDFVERMIAANILSPLDHSAIPNFTRNIGAAFRQADFDPGRRYSMPYMWGTIGIGYRKSRVSERPDSWRWLLDSNAYRGRSAILGDAQAVLGTTSVYLGNSFNTTNPAQIRQAADLLIRQKPNWLTIADDNGQDLLLSGECDVVMEWNGDILQVMEEDDDLDYLVPREGGLVWQDCLCIPNGAPHPENAHKFINFILDAQVGADIADYIQYATPNDAARALLSDDYAKNTAIFPPDDVISKLESALYLGEDIADVQASEWTRVLAA